MNIAVLNDEQKKMQLRITQSENCEFENPKDYYFHLNFNLSMFSYINFFYRLQNKGTVKKDYNDLELDKIFESFKRLAIIESKKQYAITYSQNIPDRVFDIFITHKKDTHEKVFRNICFTMDQLLCFYFKSFEKYKCLYSKYLFIIQNEGIDSSKMPQGADIEKTGVLLSLVLQV